MTERVGRRTKTVAVTEADREPNGRSVHYKEMYCFPMDNLVPCATRYPGDLTSVAGVGGQSPVVPPGHGYIDVHNPQSGRIDAIGLTM